MTPLGKKRGPGSCFIHGIELRVKTMARTIDKCDTSGRVVDKAFGMIKLNKRDMGAGGHTNKPSQKGRAVSREDTGDVDTLGAGPARPR